MNEIILGDAYELIKRMPDKSVDLIYTDVPYDFGPGGFGGIATKTEARKKLYHGDVADFKNGFDHSILEEFCRVCKKIYVYIWCSKLQIKEIMDFFVSKGCAYDILVWCKSNCTPFANNNYLPNLEYCLLFRGRGTSLNHCKNGKTKSKYFVSGTNVADKARYLHPTIKPIEFVMGHILNSTDEGDVVLDPFAGSGTTLLAAKRTGRNYIGFEINEKYWKIAKDRLEGWDALGQMDLFDNGEELK